MWSLLYSIATLQHRFSGFIDAAWLQMGHDECQKLQWINARLVSVQVVHSLIESFQFTFMWCSFYGSLTRQPVCSVLRILDAMVHREIALQNTVGCTTGQSCSQGERAVTVKERWGEKERALLKHLLSRSQKHYAKERCQDLIQFPLHFFFSQHQSESSFNREMMSRRQKQYAQVKTEKMAKESIWIGSYDHRAPKKPLFANRLSFSMGQIFL